MFYDGILCAIISKGEKNHEIINDALHYLKLNNKANAKILTDIPYLIFKNLDFLESVDSYTLINVKSSINEYKRKNDLDRIKKEVSNLNITYYGNRITNESMQIFIKKIDEKLEYKLKQNLKDINVLSISSKLIIYESSDLFNTDLINNNYLTRFIIINSGNNYSLDEYSAYLGEITNVNSIYKCYKNRYFDIDFNYNYYADIINYLNKKNNRNISEIILSLAPEFYKNNFNDYYNRINTLYEGPIYLISTDGTKLSCLSSKDNAFDAYIGFNENNIYITNENINLFNCNKFYSISNFLEIDLETKKIKRISDCLKEFKEYDNKLYIIENNESKYEELFDLNEELIEVCKDNVSYDTFLNGLYPSIRKTKLDMFYTTADYLKSIYFKNVFLSLDEYENILKLKNDFTICNLDNKNLEDLINEKIDIFILDDESYKNNIGSIKKYFNNSLMILVTKNYKFSDFASYLSNGISLIYPYKAYMTITALESKKILETNSINTYLRYLKNNLSRLMTSFGIHYIKSFIGSLLYKRVEKRTVDKMLLIKLEEALKSNDYNKYLDYSAYLSNSFTYKDEIDVSTAKSKEYIECLFKSILNVSSDVKKYLNNALNCNIQTLDKRFIDKLESNEVLIDFTDDSKNINLTDYDMYLKHKIIPNTPLIGLKYYFDIFSFKDLKEKILELHELKKDIFVIIKINDISNIIDYVTSGVDEIILDDINLLKKANDILINKGLRDNVLLSLEYDYYNAYDIINASINGSNRFFFKKSILISLGCSLFNKCYKCPNGLFGNLKYYGNDVYLKRFIEFISYEVHVVSSLIGYNGFNMNHKNYLTKESNINDMIIKNAKSGITDMSCNALGENNIGVGLNEIDKKVFIRINGNVGYNFGSNLKNNITLSLNGSAQKYLGKELDGGSIYVYNNLINEVNDEKNYLVGMASFYKANSGKAFIDGYASSFFGLANNGATILSLGADDYCCSYMTNGVAIILGEVGNNFCYNMTGGIVYLYDEFNNVKYRLNNSLVDVVKLDGEDILYLSNILNEFKEVTKSKKGIALTKYINTDLFVKIVPKNYNYMLKVIKNKEKSGLSFDEAVKEVSTIAKNNG